MNKKILFSVFASLCLLVGVNVFATTTGNTETLTNTEPCTEVVTGTSETGSVATQVSSGENQTPGTGAVVTTSGTTGNETVKTGSGKTGVCAQYRASLQQILKSNRDHIKANRGMFKEKYGHGLLLKEYVSKKLSKEERKELKKAIQVHKEKLKELYQAKKSELKKTDLSGAIVVMESYKNELIKAFTGYANTLKAYVDPKNAAKFDEKVAARIKLYEDNFARRIENIRARVEFRAECFSAKAQNLARTIQAKVEKVMNATKDTERKVQQLQKMLDTLNRLSTKAKDPMREEIQAQIVVVQNALLKLTTTLPEPTVLAE